MSPFRDVEDAQRKLEEVGYLADTATATVVHLAVRLGRPILVEGPAGVGKTELARALSTLLPASLIRLQCYEGLDEAKALYEWNYQKQLLRITHARGDGTPDVSRDASPPTGWDALEEDLFSERYLLERPLLRALRAEEPTVLLIDEVDKVDQEFEALLLEILADNQVSIPELGTVSGPHRPVTVLTSNATRELSEALRRRCLYLHLDYPSIEQERAIILARVPEAGDQLAAQLAQVVHELRTLELRKRPSVAETLDWARTLLALGAGAHGGIGDDGVATVSDELLEALAGTLGVVLKHRRDIELARGHLVELATPGTGPGTGPR